MGSQSQDVGQQPGRPGQQGTQSPQQPNDRPTPRSGQDKDKGKHKGKDQDRPDQMGNKNTGAN
jgi:hypothetical protein